MTALRKRSSGGGGVRVTRGVGVGLRRGACSVSGCPLGTGLGHPVVSIGTCGTPACACGASISRAPGGGVAGRTRSVVAPSAAAIWAGRGVCRGCGIITGVFAARALGGCHGAVAPFSSPSSQKAAGSGGGSAVILKAYCTGAVAHPDDREGATEEKTRYYRWYRSRDS